MGFYTWEEGVSLNGVFFASSEIRRHKGRGKSPSELIGECRMGRRPGASSESVRTRHWCPKVGTLRLSAVNQNPEKAEMRRTYFPDISLAIHVHWVQRCRPSACRSRVHRAPCHHPLRTSTGLRESPDAE